ncbi:MULTISPECIES: dihydrodiol dehydrogenase [Metallosphaera]|uniref:Dihydrodiol dehydrogenase n=1 Tax=Metallosphaera prunae TaxID=47304 RepID=A0A4D8RW00_METPR|nr:MULTISPECIES: dihydrodiol dehydrogenase [Metallosphaera]QCO29126.1 dihydrodiol dehydrogenase [Metallosphaera prunae]BBL47290.1 hypothetical protein MJ1HA_1391 [Metallosphaera sedula]
MDSEIQPFEKAEDYITIANEYAEVLVRKVYTRNGARLEIYSPKLGYRIFLSAIELEALTWAPKQIFEWLLQTPLGPDRVVREYRES